MCTATVGPAKDSTHTKTWVCSTAAPRSGSAAPVPRRAQTAPVGLTINKRWTSKLRRWLQAGSGLDTGCAVYSDRLRNRTWSW